jgi:acyl-CoA thioesterase-1
VTGRARLRLLSFLLALGSVATFCAAAEGVLRIVEWRAVPPREMAFRKSTTAGLGYEFVAGARLPWSGRDIRVNSLGFRGPEFPARTEGRPRVAILGDSIAAGYGVAEEEAIPARVTEALRADAVAADVLGVGVPGYNMAHLLALWKGRVRELEPRVVVYVVCLNDALPELSLSADGRLEAVAVEVDPSRAERGRVRLPGKRWLFAHSALYRFLVGRYDRALQRLGVRTRPLPPTERLDALYPDSPLGEAYRARLRELGKSVRESGATLIVACVPTADQVRGGGAAPQASLAATARQMDVAFIDLLPLFRQATMPADLFLADGLHPSARGLALAAAPIAAGVRAALQEPERGSARAGSAPNAR